MVNKYLTLKEIKRLIPHREPMLLIDKVKVIKHFDSAIGEKKIKNDAHFFKGHFPKKPIMPAAIAIPYKYPAVGPIK